jgi:hypothetical protein
MKLSQVNPTPKYPVTIPSNKKKASYRPFLVKEEKALLAAQESEDVGVMLTTLKQIVEQCIEPASAVAGMTSFDLEYLFTMIRAKSVGEYSDLIFTCECDSPKNKTKVSIDLRTVEVVFPEGISNKIKISDTITVLMKYPTMDELIEIESNRENTSREKLVASAIESIFVEDDVYHAKEEPESELAAFIDSLTSKQFALLEQFISESPVAQIKVKYKCVGCGKDNEKVLKGLSNFF